uniref:APOA1 protein n=1 Tax=Malurus cyaneus samueli TaxID=2593467 RepID=A0A8C5TKS6_9PASS
PGARSWAAALAYLRGTASLFLQHDDPQAPLDRLKDMLDVYLETVKASGKEAIAQFEASTVGKQLDLKLGENLDTLGAAAAKLREDMAPYYKEVREMWLKDTEALRAELTKDLEEVKEKIKPFLDQFSAKWTEDLEQYPGRWPPLTRRTGRRRRDPFCGGFHVEELRKNVAPFSDELRQKLSQKLEEIREKGIPQAAEYQAKVVEQLSNLREKMTPLVQDFKERLTPYTETLKARFISLLEDLQKSVA